MFLFLWVTRFVIHLQEKWKHNLPWRLWLLNMHKSKPEIRTASYDTTVVGSVYCDKIVHTKVQLLLTTWQTCINANSYASLKSNRALIYQLEGTETVNFKMFKGTIFVGYQIGVSFCVPDSPTVATFGPVKIGTDAEIAIHWRSFIIAVLPSNSVNLIGINAGILFLLHRCTDSSEPLLFANAISHLTR